MTASRVTRVALIDLDAPQIGVATGVSWASNAHLPYLRDSSRYELMALQNSTKERAARPVEAYRLDTTLFKAFAGEERVWYPDSESEEA